MSVKRISDSGLEKIINNRVMTPVTCVVKFYSNGCHLCHALQSYFVDLSDLYEYDPNIVFYAYNIDDDPSIVKKLKFDGVPSIAVFNPNPELPRNRFAPHKFLDEPMNPHEKTWYKVKDIKKFIETERIKK